MKELIELIPFLEELGIETGEISFEKAIALKIVAKRAILKEYLKD